MYNMLQLFETTTSRHLSLPDSTFRHNSLCGRTKVDLLRGEENISQGN